MDVDLENAPVLIVDDDLDTLLMIGLHFENLGIVVEKFSDPQAAVTLAVDRLERKKPFRLIVTDIRMPYVNGNEFSKRLREAGYEGAILAFTASATGEGRKEGTIAGIDRYFSKDTLSTELVQAIVDEYVKD